jgi:hypothetical protein
MSCFRIATQWAMLISVLMGFLIITAPPVEGSGSTASLREADVSLGQQVPIQSWPLIDQLYADRTSKSIEKMTTP